jgi:hypothetical protein
VYHQLSEAFIDYLYMYGRANKPVMLNGFGLVSQSNAGFFVPFNTTEAPFASIFGNSTAGSNATSFITEEQRDEVYALWLRAGLEAGLQGMFQYQVCYISLIFGFLHSAKWYQ